MKGDFFMKKLSCILLALIIALSLSTVAFAAPESISAGETKSVTLTSGQKKVFTFSVKETAVYSIKAKAKNDCYVTCEVANVESSKFINICIASLDDEESAYCSFPAQKGSMFTLTICEGTEYVISDDEDDMPAYDLPAKAEFTLSKSKLPSVALNGTYKVLSGYTEYQFMPSKSGYYNFRSDCKDAEIDPFIEVSDELGNSFTNDDIGYDGDLNFDLTAYLEKGMIYLVRVMADAVVNDFDDYEFTEPENVNFSFTVKDGSKIRPEMLIAQDNKITLARNDYDYAGVVLAPSGAVLNFNEDDVIITSSNAKVADAENVEFFDNEIHFDINSYNRFGKTTLTVEIPGGISTEIQVKVVPRIVIFIENLFALFRDLFSNNA